MITAQNITAYIKKDGIGVIPTDTLYGIVGSAFSKKAVKRIYEVRKREKSKPFIVLISSINDLEKFGIKNFQSLVLNKIWVKRSGSISVILSCPSKKFEYLHRGTKSIAFRLPQNKELQNLLKKTGPLVAPSANISGQPPAMTILQAKKYFGNQVDFYITGKTKKKASRIISLISGEPIIIRE